MDTAVRVQVEAVAAQQQQEQAAAAEAETARAAQANLSPMARMAPAALGISADAFAPDDAIGSGIIVEAGDVLRKMMAWEQQAKLPTLSASARATAATEVENGRRALGQLTRSAQMHQHWLLQQAPVEQVDAAANRVEAMAELGSAELLGQVKGAFPHLGAALDAKTITMDDIATEIDFGRTDIPDQVAKIMARHNNTLKLSGKLAPAPPTPAGGTPSPGNPASAAPGETAGYSGGGSGKELSPEDYYAKLGERSRANLAN